MTLMRSGQGEVNNQTHDLGMLGHTRYQLRYRRFNVDQRAAAELFGLHSLHARMLSDVRQRMHACAVAILAQGTHPAPASQQA